jgi:hypothetical protein
MGVDVAGHLRLGDACAEGASRVGKDVEGDSKAAGMPIGSRTSPRCRWRWPGRCARGSSLRVRRATASYRRLRGANLNGKIAKRQNRWQSVTCSTRCPCLGYAGQLRMMQGTGTERHEPGLLPDDSLKAFSRMPVTSSMDHIFIGKAYMLSYPVEVAPTLQLQDRYHPPQGITVASGIYFQKSRAIIPI